MLKFDLQLFFPSFSGQDDYYFKELLPMAVIGVIGGLLGEFFFPFLAFLAQFIFLLTVSFLMAFSFRGII